MYGPDEAANTQTALLEPRRSLQNVGSKDKKEDDDDRNSGNGDGQFRAFGADGFTFLDILDIINPLQHIPLVASIYRDLTGDEIDPASRVIGGTLFGGPFGTIAAMVNVSLEESTGKDMGDHVMAFFEGEDDSTDDAADGPVLANAPVSSGQLAATSQITDNIEVLNWARREAALMGGAGGGADEQAWARPNAEAETNGGVSDATAHALRVSQRTGDVAGHMEVLEWARRETAASRAAAAADEASRGEEKARHRRAQDNVRQAGLDNTTRTLARHDQLAGATAPGGGWFSETMLTALANYQQSAQLGKVADPRQGLKAVNVSN